jgi:glycosyltransferase involved in cell wall biosynthesis
MRLLITTDIFPPDIGGPASYVPAIARALHERGHEVGVLTYSRVPPQEGDSEWPFALRRLPLNVPRPWRLLRAVAAIWQAARRAELIYANGMFIEVALANLALRRPLAVKVVGDIAWERARHRGWAADDIEAFQARRYGWRVEVRRALRNWALRRARLVVVPSQFLKRLASQHWGIPAGRISVIYNAFQPEAAEQETPLIPLTAGQRIITVCRLTPWKGVDGLLAALGGLPDVGLVVVGTGPESARLQRLAEELGVAGRVYFAGQVPREQVGGYLRAADLFVLNSTYEGFPHVVLEAMAVGLPVVAADAGGSGELVQDGVSGRLVPPGDPLALRRAIAELLADRALAQRLAANARQHLARFDHGRMVQQTEEALCSIGRSGGGSR